MHKLPAALFTLLIGVALPSWAGEAKPASEMSPAELMRAVVANEVKAANTSTVQHSFRSLKRTPHGVQIKLYIETRDSMAGMVIAYDGKPLTPAQLSAETGHLDWLMNNPDQLRKKRAHEKQDAERSLRIVKALPEAFLFQSDGVQESAAGLGAGLGKMGDPLIKLKFSPNPSYAPPSHAEQVLTAMRGYILVDASSLRLAKINGTLFKEVTFGWGIAGRLNPGGHFIVQQADVGDGNWEITHMDLNFTGKILLFKSLNIVSDETFSDFHRVPDDITFTRAVEMLKAEQAKLAHNAEPNPQANGASPR